MIASLVVLAADRLGTLALTTTHRIVALAQPLDLTPPQILTPPKAPNDRSARYCETT